MSCIFIRPVLQEGNLPSANASYDDPGDYSYWPSWASSDDLDIVDAAQILDTWALLFSKCNGGLNGTDLSPDNTIQSLDEDSWLWDLESFGPQRWPTVGSRHSHDGVDSALLGSSILHTGNLPEGRFGILRSPSSQVSYLMFGNAGYEDGLQHNTVEGYSTLNDRNLAMPWNSVLGGHTYFRDYASDTGTIGTCRILCQAMIPDIEKYSAEQRAGLRLMTIKKLHDGVVDEEVTSVEINATYVDADDDMFSIYTAQWAAIVVI